MVGTVRYGTVELSIQTGFSLCILPICKFGLGLGKENAGVDRGFIHRQRFCEECIYVRLRRRSVFASRFVSLARMNCKWGISVCWELSILVEKME